jgi:hypothetical protein
MEKRSLFVGASEFDPPNEHFVGRKDIDVGWRAEVCVRAEVKDSEQRLTNQAKPNRHY